MLKTGSVPLNITGNMVWFNNVLRSENVKIKYIKNKSQKVFKGRTIFHLLTLNEYSSRTKKGKLTAWRILFSFSVCSICLSFTT